MACFLPSFRYFTLISPYQLYLLNSNALIQNTIIFFSHKQHTVICFPFMFSFSPQHFFSYLISLFAYFVSPPPDYKLHEVRDFFFFLLYYLYLQRTKRVPGYLANERMILHMIFFQLNTCNSLLIKCFLIIYWRSCNSYFMIQINHSNSPPCNINFLLLYSLLFCFTQQPYHEYSLI